MPELCRFYGIIISMYGREHDSPHFHAEYNGSEAIFDLTEGAFTKGALPTKQARLVVAWYEIHKEELFEIWETKELKKIDPIQ